MKVNRKYTTPKLCSYGRDIFKPWFIYFRIESGKIALSYAYLSNIASAFSMNVVDIITSPETYIPRINPSSTKVLVEIDVSNDEFIKIGLKDEIIQVLNK
jgi:hypothetical protein